MKNKTYILNTFLTAVLGIYLLVAVIVRTFCPQIILPKANIPNMVLVSLVALVLDHYLAPDAKRFPFFLLLPLDFCRMLLRSVRLLKRCGLLL